MQNFKKLFFIVLAFTLVTIGCEKDKDPDTAPVAKSCYITKMDYGTDGYEIMEYNSNHQLIAITEYEADGTATNITNSITYDGDKLMEFNSIDNGNVDLKIEYKYSSQSTPDSAIIWNDDGNGNLSKSGVFSLTFNGTKLVKSELVYNYMGQSIAISKNEYSYTGDNLSEVITYKINSSMQLELESTITYNYDTKKNAIHDIGLNYFFFNLDIPFMSKNNIIESIYKDKDGNVDQSKSYTNTIEYNDKEYPAKITTNNADNNKTEVVNYTYNCQ